MKRFSLLSLIAGALLLTGCSAGYYAGGPPPPVRVEARGFAPGQGYVWVDGYWGYNRNAYAWTPGYWTRPPRGRSVWVAPGWQSRGGRYHFRPGRWR
ncbi:MAG: hypothetical protein WDO18_06925 [Acidobacteriota bacterium]